jgi:DNA polymerase-3 subunit beta
MDFVISTKEHRAAVDAASDALPRRSGILPALTLIRIEAHDDGRISYEGTDLEFSIRVEIRGDVTTSGSLCVSGHQLAAIAAESDRNGSTRVCMEGTKCVIEAGYEPREEARRKPATFRLSAAPADDYVGGPNPATSAPLTVSGDLLRAMAARVAWVASREESKGTLCGVLIETTDKVLRLVATNGHQLALSETEVPGLTPGIQRVVPPQLLATAERLLKGRGPVELSLAETSVGLRVAGMTLTATTLAGDYPTYSRVLPKNPTTVVQLPTATLLQSVRRMATVAATHEFKAVIARAENRGLRLWTRTPDVGTAHDEVQAAVLNEPVTVAFNAAMMADVLATVASPDVRVRFHGPRGGILIDGRGESPIRSLWLVMPVSQEKLDLTEPEQPSAAGPELPAAAEPAPLAAAA